MRRGTTQISVKFAAEVARSGLWPGPNESRAESAQAPAVVRQAPPALALEEELLLAEADLERGDFIELSREELDHCIQTGALRPVMQKGPAAHVS